MIFSTSPAPTRRKKCRYESKGKCKEKQSCEFFHPKKTCQNFSKLGSCSTGNQCNFRHPIRICKEWQDKRECQWSDRCRFRHPLEHIQNPFLGLSVQNLQKDPYPKHPQKQPQILNPYQHLQNLLKIPPANYIPKQPMIFNPIHQQPVIPSKVQGSLPVNMNNNQQYMTQFPTLFSIPPPPLVGGGRRQ